MWSSTKNVLALHVLISAVILLLSNDNCKGLSTAASTKVHKTVIEMKIPVFVNFDLDCELSY